MVDASSSDPEYKPVAHLLVLGCTVSHNASVEDCFPVTTTKNVACNSSKRRTVAFGHGSYPENKVVGLLRISHRGRKMGHVALQCRSDETS